MSAGDPWVPGTVIDVSKWQTALPNLSGVIGVIARAGIGTKPDSYFIPHIRNARAAGKWVGSYWFNWGSLSVSAQVDAYIAREKEVGGVDLHVIDWEGADGFTAAQTADFIRIYQARTRLPIGLYASESRFRDLGQDWNWIANYSQEPRKSYDMWQYGPFRGVDGNNARERIIELVRGGPDITGEPQNDMATLSTSGLTLTSDYSLHIPEGSEVHETSAPGSPLLSYSYGTGVFDYFGTSGGLKAIRVGTPSGSVIGFTATQAAPFKKTVVPTTDTTPYSQADLDAIRASDQIALDAAQAAVAAAKADAALAAANERERIALALSAAEAARVRNTAP